MDWSWDLYPNIELISTHQHHSSLLLIIDRDMILAKKLMYSLLVTIATMQLLSTCRIAEEMMTRRENEGKIIEEVILIKREAVKSSSVSSYSNNNAEGVRELEYVEEIKRMTSSPTLSPSIQKEINFVYEWNENIKIQEYSYNDCAYYRNESSEEFGYRMGQWDHQIQEIKTKINLNSKKSAFNQNAKVFGYPVQHIPSSIHLVRSAVEIEPMRFIVGTLRASPRYFSFGFNAPPIIDQDCMINNITPCKCTWKTPYLSQVIEFFEGNLYPRIDCIANDNNYTSLIGKEPLSIVLNGTFHIPIEMTYDTKKNGDNERDVDVCLQGLLFGDHYNRHQFKAFIGHYSRLGVKRIHFYTNNTLYINEILSVKTKNTEIWIHDIPLPPYKAGKTVIGTSTYKLQPFVINDCLMKAKSMKSQWISTVDFDEFAYPYEFPPGYTTSKQKPPQLFDIVEAEYNFHSKLTETPPYVFWMRSYPFLCGHCLPSIYDQSNKTDPFKHSLLDHYGIAHLDTESANGRRKAWVKVGAVPASEIATAYFFIHEIYLGDLIGKSRQYFSLYLHLHHLRLCTFQDCQKILSYDDAMKKFNNTDIFSPRLHIHRPESETKLPPIEDYVYP